MGVMMWNCDLSHPSVAKNHSVWALYIVHCGLTDINRVWEPDSVDVFFLLILVLTTSLTASDLGFRAIWGLVLRVCTLFISSCYFSLVYKVRLWLRARITLQLHYSDRVAVRERWLKNGTTGMCVHNLTIEETSNKTCFYSWSSERHFYEVYKFVLSGQWNICFLSVCVLQWKLPCAVVQFRFGERHRSAS